MQEFSGYTYNECETGGNRRYGFRSISFIEAGSPGLHIFSLLKRLSDCDGMSCLRSVPDHVLRPMGCG